jgi:hypothetical protein
MQIGHSQSWQIIGYLTTRWLFNGLDWTTIIQIFIVLIATILLRGTKLFWIILVGTLSALLATILVFFQKAKHWH